MSHTPNEFESWVKTVMIVVLNWNLPHDTIACIESLLGAGLASDQILLVDNGSDDQSLDHFSLEIPHVPVLSLPDNLGFAAGNNRGVKHILAQGQANWILLLNNDTIAAEDMFLRMWKGLQETSAAIVSPLILYHPDCANGQNNLIWSSGDIMIANSLLTRSTLNSNIIPASLPEVVSADFLTACALLVQKEVFETIGLLNEDYFMYAEDADFCLRASKQNFKLACLPNARVYHKVSKSTESDTPRRRRLKIRSQIQFYRQHASTKQLVLLVVATWLRCFKLTVSDLSEPKRFHLILASYQAWWHGWTRQLTDAL